MSKEDTNDTTMAEYKALTVSTGSIGNCRSCANFKRAKWRDGTTQFGGHCPAITKLLKVENSKMVFLPELYVQDSFGCILFQSNDKV